MKRIFVDIKDEESNKKNINEVQMIIDFYYCDFDTSIFHFFMI